MRFAYDDDAFYVGARMWARNAKEIQAPLGRRDNTDQAEHILIALDTFLDRRTSVVLGVTAAGVRLDRYHGTDNEESFDTGFDLVWVARTSDRRRRLDRRALDSVHAAALQPGGRRSPGD